MKFLSVCVLYISMRVAYSYYVGPTSVSSYPIGSTDEYTNYDSQNSYDHQQNPISESFQRTVPVPKVSTNVPQLPIPPYHSVYSGTYKLPQSGSINPSYASPAQQIINSPYLQQMYTKYRPTTRFTIIHPNGTIEHRDEIDSVTRKYSDYIMLKATDILNNVGKSNQYKTPTVPLHNKPPDQLNKPITTPKQNIDTTVTNSYKGQYNDQFLYKNSEVPVVPNLSPDEKSNHLNSLSSSGSYTKAVVSSSAAINNPVIQLTESIPEEVNSKPIIEHLHENAIAGNPLPIYSSIPEPAVNVENDKRIDIPDAINNDLVTQGSANTIVTSNLDSVSSFDENETSSNNAITSTKSIVALEPPKDIDGLEREILPFNLHDVEPQNSFPEVLTTSITESGQSDIVPLDQSIPTIEEAVTSNKLVNVSSSKDTSTGNLQPIDTSKTSENSTSNTEIHRNISTDHQNDTNYTNQEANRTLTTSDDHGSVTLFTLSEDRIWEALRSNYSNVYFFFLPPRPKVSKETRTTIFPNGTSVEEIIETDLDVTEDGQPRVIKNITLIHN